MQVNHPGALLGLVRALLMQGKGQESQLLLREFPASSEYNTAKLLGPVALAFTEPGDADNDFDDAGDADNDFDDALEAAFRNGIRLAKRGNILAAMDGFLDILRKDRHYRSDQVRDIFIGLLALIGDNHPEARQYRQELASVLF